MSARVVMLVANGYAPDPRVHKEAKTLIKSDYSVSVLCWDRQRNRKQNEVLDGVRVRRFRFLLPEGIVSYALSGCLFLLACLFVLAKEGFQHGKVVVHCHDFNTLPVGWLLRTLSGKYKLVYDSHENFPDLLSTIAPKPVAAMARTVERLMLRRVDALIAANDLILRNLQPYSKAQGVAIYNTPALTVSQMLGPNVKSEVQRIREDLGADKFVLLYYGAMIRNRGLHALLDAASLSGQNQPADSVAFLVVGEGPLASSLHNEARVRKLEDRVRFYPLVPFERAMLMVKAADAVFIGFEPNDLNNYYASPNKLFEAMAMGTPVLASAFGLLGKFVRELGCGVTMESITGPSILEGIQKLRNEDVRKSCAANEVRWFKSHYNWDAMEERLSGIYHNTAPINQPESNN